MIFNSGTLENTYFYWGFVRTGGLALRWFKDNICQKSDDDSYYEFLTKGAEKVAPGCNNVIFLPYLTGGYGEFSKVKGCFLNMTLDTDQFVLWRAILEAIAYDYMEITDIYKNAGIEINRITITEGGSRDKLWNQIKSDIMKSEAITLENLGGAVLTNSIIAAYAIGDIKNIRNAIISNLKISNTYSPNMSNSAIYTNQYSIQKDMLKKLCL